MEDDILPTIDVLTARVKAKEEEANKLKKLVNELCSEAGIPNRYANVSASGSVAAIRSDQFYGLTLTAAIRNYLEIRKASGLGSASVHEIHRAVRNGGYKFDTKNEENARIGVGNALRKTSSIFHRLPGGQYGLLSWYPSARDASNGDGPTKRGRPSKNKPGKKEKKQGKDENMVTNKEVRDVILAQTGNFRGADIEKALKAALPAKTILPTKIPTVLFLLKKQGQLKIASPRSGKMGATFCKA
jgi:anti-sigma28 factor (negative regulator of flagellin synthesis)